VAHLGVWDYAPLRLNGALSARGATTTIHVFGFTSKSGTNMHFPYLGNTTNRLEFKFGFGLRTTNTKVKGRQESFDQQYFSSGGIGFVIDLNPQDSGQIDTYYSDY
jgi:hypothetical protein